MENLFGFYISVLSLQALWICDSSHLKGQRSTRRKFKNFHPHDDCWDHNRNHYGNRFNITRERMYPTPYQNSTLLRPLLVSLVTQKHSPDTTRHIQREYDYIIVGAGSAGSVLAARLSEKKCVSVLLLEAGPPPPLLSDIPVIARTFFMTDIDWNFLTVPQKYTAFGLNNGQVPWPSGRTLGGSGVFNAMLAVRGDRKDYDAWEELGAKGWSWKHVLPYFIKMEDNVDWDIANNGFHGVGGPVTVGRPPYFPVLKKAVIEAAGILGYPFRDTNTGNGYGFSDLQGTIRKGQRCSAAKAYLVPSDKNKNLDIVTGALVTKILFDGKRAVGVQLDYKGKHYKVRARKEVIVSAGAINTPKLLILSGIGPRQTLRDFKIRKVADLPVGLNFHDHPITVQNLEVNSPKIPRILQKITDPENIQLYIDKKVGPLTSLEGMNNIAFLRSNHSHHNAAPLDYQLYFMEADTSVPRFQLNIKPKVYEQLYGPYENRTFMFCVCSVLHPKSRGYVTINSTDPYVPPLIEPNFFKHPDDVFEAVSAMKACIRVAGTPPMRKLGVKPFKATVLGCEEFPTNGDDYLECVARSIIVPNTNSVGTAKMGDPRDPTTVVDPELRVKGIKGLRVVDSSVMPRITSGNINLPTLMIAEKASDIIKRHIRCG